MTGLGDHERRPGADDPGALTQDHLDPARVTVGPRELVRPLGGLDVGDPDHSPFDLRDRLLGDHDDVGSLEASGAERRLVQLAGEIVALAQLGDPHERHDADARPAQRIPEMRTPACAL